MKTLSLVAASTLAILSAACSSDDDSSADSASRSGDSAGGATTVRDVNIVTETITVPEIVYKNETVVVTEIETETITVSELETYPEVKPFTIGMIPDTQNMIDYTHQNDGVNKIKVITGVDGEGKPTTEEVDFPFDAADQFIAMMQHLADNTEANGGDIAFVTSVGDVWQHQSLDYDDAHEGLVAPRTGTEPLEVLAPGYFTGAEETQTAELPKAVEGYDILAASGVPFGVAPGNHDFDAMWPVGGLGDIGKTYAALGAGDYSVLGDPEVIGMLHLGGLDNFRSVFGDDKDYFAGKDWYVSSFDGGANSAQIFKGGGYTFLNLSLQFHASDEVLEWAQSVIDNYPGVPTLITTHDFLDTHAERRSNPLVDPEYVQDDAHNSAEEVFRKLIAPNDQIFMVLCGHHHGQASRIDFNNEGHLVYQILADYQDRAQSLLDYVTPMPSALGSVTIGDGWLREMTFHMGDSIPKVAVKTYSALYEKYSSDYSVEQYASMYKDADGHSEWSDAQFVSADEFKILLPDFRERFGLPQ